MCMSTPDEKLLGKLLSRNRIKSLKDQVQQCEILALQLYNSCHSVQEGHYWRLTSNLSLERTVTAYTGSTYQQ